MFNLFFLSLSYFLSLLFSLKTLTCEVNVASRMESTGKAGAIQVTEETCHILQMFGYTFEQRGLVAVKGKGQLMTYYLIGKNDKPPTSPMVINTRHEESNEDEKTSPKNLAPESPNPLTLSSATASPSSVRLNQNYQMTTNGNTDSLESNCCENADSNKTMCIKISEKDPLLSPKTNAAINNHFGNDEKSSLLESS